MTDVKHGVEGCTVDIAQFRITRRLANSKGFPLQFGIHKARPNSWSKILLGACDDRALFIGYSIQVVNQIVDLGVRGGDFTLQTFRFCGRELAGMLFLFDSSIRSKNATILTRLTLSVGSQKVGQADARATSLYHPKRASTPRSRHL
jgi:hypothetical protein